MVEDKKKIQEMLKKVITDCIQAIIPPIMKTGTIVDKTDPKLSQEDTSFGFGNFGNLANLTNLAI